MNLAVVAGFADYVADELKEIFATLPGIRLAIELYLLDKSTYDGVCEQTKISEAGLVCLDEIMRNEAATIEAQIWSIASPYAFPSDQTSRTPMLTSPIREYKNLGNYPLLHTHSRGGTRERDTRAVEWKIHYYSNIKDIKDLLEENREYVSHIITQCWLRESVYTRIIGECLYRSEKRFDEVGEILESVYEESGTMAIQISACSNCTVLISLRRTLKLLRERLYSTFEEK